MILEKINAFAESLPQNAKPPFQLRMSSSGDCIRLLYYEKTLGKKPISAKHFFRMEIGHAIHKMFQEFLSLSLGEDFYGSECEVKIQGNNCEIVGHPDGRIKSLRAIVEIKSVSEATFQLILREGKPLESHIAQGNTYAISLKEEWVLIIYINRDSGEMEEFMFQADPELYAQTIAKFADVLDFAAKKEIPQRPYHDASGSPCWFCPYKETCYEGFKLEVDSMAKAAIDDPSFLASVQGAILQRTTRLSAEKAEDVFKKQVADWMFERKINFAQTSDGLVTLGVGKNGNLLPNIKPTKKETP